MESHPVPQNVTSFEFHLVGNMTMRQFGYLAAGLIIAYITFMIFATSLPLLAYPVIFISAATGAAYAFLPIMERPLDYWTASFIKAISKPTLRKFQPNILIENEDQFRNRVAIYFEYLQKNQLAGTQSAPSVAVSVMSAVGSNTIGALPVTDNLQSNNEPQSAAPTVQQAPTQSPSPQFSPQPQVQVQQPQNLPIPTPLDVNPTNTSAQPGTPNADQPIAVNGDNANNIFNLGEFSPYTIKDQSVGNSAATPSANPPASTPDPNSPAQPAAPHANPVSEFLSTLSNLANEVASAVHQPSEPKDQPAESAATVPSQEQLEKTVELAQESHQVQQKIMEAEKKISQIKNTAATDQSRTALYTQEFQSVLAELQGLNQHAQDIAHELAVLSQNPVSQGQQVAVVKPSIIPTLTLTTTPNIINGIVTDVQGNYVEGAIVVAHDKQTLPVRALKTNKLGQFIAATPLPDGVYTLTIEKDNLMFDVAQIELTGEVINPIVITAKKAV